MRRSGRSQPGQVLPLDGKPRRSRNDPYQNELLAGSERNLNSRLGDSASTQYDRRSCISQPSTWIPRLGSNQNDDSDFVRPPRESEHETQAIRTAKNLLRRFKASEQYMKYRNRQHKDNRQGQEQKWPDHLEEAFFRALVKYPPMGRRMLLHNGKQRGRNELIADEINQLTGEERSRKQISSHIQVLKPFVKHDSLIMKFLSKDDVCDSGQQRASHGRRALYSSRRAPYRHGCSYSHQGLSINTLPEFIAPRTQENHRESFEPTNFRIFVQQKQGDCVRPLHTYTRSVGESVRTNLVVSNGAILQKNFPPLARLHAQAPLTCGILIADSSLAFPINPLKDMPGVELGVQLQFRNRRITDLPLRCENTFYYNGQVFPDQNDPGTNVSITAMDDMQGSEASVKFGSTFWAKHLSHLTQAITDTAQFDSHTVKEDIAAYISRITALQQISMPDGHGGFETILVIFWTFRHASEARGLTRWRNLIIPPPFATRGSRPLGSASQFPCTDSALGRASIHGLPVHDGDGIPLIGHHIPQYLAPPSSHRRDSTSPSSALSSYTWPTPVYPSSFDWSTASTDDTFDLPSRDVNFGFDPLLRFSNPDATAHNDFGAPTVEMTTDPNTEHYPPSWNADRHQATTDVFNNLPKYASSNYDSDPDYAYGGELIPALAQMDCLEHQQEHHPGPYEEPYGYSLAPPSQSSCSHSYSREMSQAGFSPHSNLSPMHEELSTFPESREPSIPPNSISSPYGGAREEARVLQTLQPPWYAPHHEPQVQGFPSRISSASPHDRALSETAAYDFNPPPSQPQAGSEGEVHGGVDHEPRWKSSFALTVEAPSPWKDARRNLRQRSSSSVGKY